MSKKRTKAVDIVGRWVDLGDKVVQYKNLPKDVKCSKCITGTDKNCPICHGANCEPPIKWYRLIKRLKNRLKKWLE